MISVVLKPSRVAALALAVALFTLVAGPAEAGSKHRRHKSKRTTSSKVVKRAVAKPTVPANRIAPAPIVAAAPASTPAPTATPTPAPYRGFTSVISIGGHVFYNLTYLEAVEAYFAAVAAAPPGYTPPPVTSISLETTVTGTVNP